MSIKKEILKILELKNEQSFYQKQRQDKKIIHFLKSMPLGVLEEFNEINKNSFSEVSTEMLYFASKKYLKLINLFYKKTKLHNSLYDKNVNATLLYLFSYLMSAVTTGNAMPKLWDSGFPQKMIKDKDTEREILNLFLEYDLKEIKINFFSFMHRFNYDLYEDSQITDINYGEFIEQINSFNEYDFIFIINNFINEHRPLITMLSYFNESEQNMIKEYTIDLLCKEISFISNEYLSLEEYRKVKKDCNNVNELKIKFDKAMDIKSKR